MEEWISWGCGEKEELERQAKRLLKYNDIVDIRIVPSGFPMWWTLEYLRVISRKDRIKQTLLADFGEAA